MLEQLEAGIALQIVLWVQNANNVFLNQLTYFLDAAGSNLAYIIVLPLLYWSIDRNMARRLLFVLIVTGMFTVGMKVGFARPRPSTAYPDMVRQMFETHSYAFPSGHVAVAAAVWTFAALWVRKWWFSLFVVLYVLVMSWSRMYSGTHYPHDVIVGAIIGTGSAYGVRSGMPWLSHFWSERVPKWFEAVLIIGVGIATALASQGEITGVAAAGAAIGGAVALVFEELFVQFRTDGSLRERAVRFVLGMVLTAVVFFGLGEVLENVKWFNIIQYSVTILFVLSIYPWIAIKLGIAEQATHEAQDASVLFNGMT